MERRIFHKILFQNINFAFMYHNVKNLFIIFFVIGLSLIFKRIHSINNLHTFMSRSLDKDAKKKEINRKKEKKKNKRFDRAFSIKSKLEWKKAGRGIMHTHSAVKSHSE